MNEMMRGENIYFQNSVLYITVIVTILFLSFDWEEEHESIPKLSNAEANTSLNFSDFLP